MNAVRFAHAVAFGLYDLDGDGFISESDLLKILLHTARGSVNPVQLEKTVTTIVQVRSAPMHAPYAGIFPLEHCFINWLVS